MEKKIILDLCGGTGAWSRPYKEAGYDVSIPSSDCINGIVGYWQSGSFNVDWSASDNVNLSYIELYYRHSSDNDTAFGALWFSTGLIQQASGTSDSGTFTVNPISLNGQGRYEFSTKAYDDSDEGTNDDEGDPAGIGDDKCGYDVTAPSSDCTNGIIGYWQSGTFNVAWTANDNVNLSHVDHWLDYIIIQASV